MLSLKRLIWIVSIALSISIIFISINLKENTREKVIVENNNYNIQKIIENDLPYIGQAFHFVLVSNKPENNQVYNNIIYLLDNWKISYETVQRVEEYDASYQKIYGFCDEELTYSTGLEQVVSYVKYGGKVVLASGIAEGNNESYLYPMLGVVEKAYKLSCNNFILAEDFLPFQEDEMKYSNFNSSTWLRLQNEAKVYVTGLEAGEPVVYSYPYGMGKTLVVNGTLLEDKSCLGLFAGLISNELEGFCYPVIGAETIYLDNFPVVTFVEDEVCLKLYGRRTNDFIENVVWPEFQSMAIKNNIKYTSSILTLGKEGDVFPFLEDSLFYTMGKSALRYDGELIAAADYSHVGNKVINSSFYEKFTEFFPKYRITSLAIINGRYLGENNEDNDIKVMRSYKYGDKDTMYIHDMGYDKGVYIYPVISEGLGLNEGNIFKIAMDVATLGILSHRIDINTLISDDEKNNIWDETKYSLRYFEERVISKLKWLDSKTLSEMANHLNGYINLEYSYEVKDDYIKIQCEQFRDGQGFYINTEKEITEVVGAEYERINSRYYFIHIIDPVVVLKLAD